MQKTLLSTKLNVPSPRQTYVVRPMLLARLDKARTYPLTLVSAPPGYGKTTLVSSWLGETDLPFTWLSLDEGDNDPIRFLEYFLTALHKVVPAIRLDALDLLQGPQTASFEALAASLINEAASASPFFVVLDDFHVLITQPILDLFAYLLEHLPPTMHLVLLSRSDPPLPLSRLRSHGQLLEIRAEQLRFNAEEIVLFFSDIMGMKLSGPDVAAIEGRTEGWIAGLQLAGLAMQSAMQGNTDLHSFIAAFTGSHAYIMDYLTEEVLSGKPEIIRSFLLQTAILERMCGSLCSAVVKVDAGGPIDGQAMLEAIERNHLFVVPLDTERRWYRYHPLFKEVLSRRLETLFPEQLPDLHRRASKWYEQQDFIHEAIQHAISSHDPDRTARLVQQHGCDLIMRGEVITLADWLAVIEPYTLSRPWLAMQKAWVLLLTGRLERAGQAIDAGERLLSTLESGNERSTLQGSFAAARAHWANMQGKTDLAAELARHALDFLADSSDFSCSLRSVATSLLGDASWRQGKMEDARIAYLDAVRIGQIANNPHMEMMSNTNLADVLFEEGQLHQAARIYAETLQIADRVDGPNSAYTLNLHFGLSRIYYDWNRLDEAAAAVEQTSRLSRQWGNVDLQAACLVLTAQVERARCNHDKAEEALAAVEERMNESQLSPIWSMWVDTAVTHFWFDQEKIENAFLLVRDAGVCPNSMSLDALSLNDIELVDPIPYRLEPVCLILLRLFLALDNPEAVLAMCERLLPGARAGRRERTVIELLVLQALAFQMKKDLPGALATLAEAITLARPEQSMRLFLDEGEPMAKLLYQMKVRSMGGDFVTGLLSYIEQPAGPELSPAQPIQKLLVEHLSARELEVLRYIAEGCSNQEIADRFFISPKTVKRHISNIYAKLEAKNRTQAVSLARALKLID